MKIAIITEYIEPQINGIATRYTEIIRNLKLQGHNVDVYAPENHSDVNYILPSIPNFYNKHNKFMFPTIGLFNDILNRNYEVVYIVLPPLLWYPLLVIYLKLRNKNIKIVTSNHVDMMSYANAYINNNFIKKIILPVVILHQFLIQNLLSDYIIAPSLFNDIKKYINKDKFHISRNGINHKKFPFKQKTNLTKNIIYVGRIAQEKNLNKLFELFLSLTNYTLTVIGDGPDLKSLKEIYKNNKNIKFEGFVEHLNLWKYFQNADFHLVTSISETFGLTLLESMATGTPVIYPDCDVFKDLYANDFNELMFDLNNNNSFNNSFNFLNENIENISKKSYEFSKKFNWDSIVLDLIKLFVR